jgi:hypothetical protein
MWSKYESVFRPRPNAARFFGLLVAIGLTVMVAGAPHAPAANRPITLPHARILASKLACMDRSLDRIVGKPHPTNCVLTGYIEESGVQAEIPMRHMKWGHWGADTTRAAYGFDKASGEHLRVILYRRTSCPGGSVWYSRMVIVELRSGHAYDFRPPVCVSGSRKTARAAVGHQTIGPASHGTLPRTLLAWYHTTLSFVSGSTKSPNSPPHSR